VSFDEWKTRTESLIDHWIKGLVAKWSVRPGSVEEAMRYSLLAGGKRLRPLLVLAAAAYLDQEPERFAPVALAVELIHTYSLIHDDLPAMDDDDWRRGQPTSHKVFGEAMAILAGDALLTEAFSVYAETLDQGFDPERVLSGLHLLAYAAGRDGLIRGQVEDLQAEHQPVTLAQLEAIHRRKTGALFRAAVVLPAVLSGDIEAKPALEAYGEHFGLAFQIVDDILNVIGDQKTMGKATGTDQVHGKATYPSLVGLAEAKRLAEAHRDQAARAIAGPRGEPLLGLLRLAVERAG